ncbi:MAG TPA: Ig-like domain-containing protein [Gemmatimonadaceae bacterium]
MCRSRSLLRTALAGVVVASVACSGDTLSPSANVASVTVSPNTPVLNVGAQLPLVATLKDAHGNTVTGADVFWSSSDTTIATVSDVGVVSALAVGTAQIAASSQGQPGLATVTVTPVPAASVVIAPKSATVTVGSTVDLQAVVYDAKGNKLNGRTIVWSSDHQNVATVDNAGHVKGVSQGQATISATSEGKSASTTVTVKTPGPPPVSEASVASVSVDPSSSTIRQGQTVQLHVTLKDAYGRTLTGRTVAWSSSASSNATVSSSGLVLGINPGDVTITATSEGKSGSAKIKVERKHVHDLTVGLATTELEVGQTTQATATLYADDGSVLSDRVVAWASSDGAVASVTGEGLVQANAPGSTTISGTSDGTSGSASLTVKQKPSPPPTGGPSSTGPSGTDGTGDHHKDKGPKHGHGSHG